LKLIAPANQLRILVLGLLTAILFCSVHAQQKVQIKSDEQTGSLTEGMIFRGNVSFKNDSLEIHAETVELKRGDGDEVSFRAERGEVDSVRFIFTGENFPNGLKAQADELSYSNEKGLLILEGSVKVIEGGYHMEADKVRINTQSGEILAEGSSDGDQVITSLELPASEP